jgi:butyrate kinase
VFNSRNNELFRKIFQSGGVVLSMSTTDNNFVDSINALGVEDVQVVPNENQDFKYCLYNKSLPENDIIKVITTLHTIDINQPYTISYLHRNLDKIQKNGLLNIVVNSTNTNVFTDKKTISSSRITEECEQGYIVVDGQCQLDLFKDSVNKCILDNTIKLHKIQNMNTQSEVIAATQNGELTSVDAVMLNNTIYQYKATTPYTLNGIVYTYIWTDNLTGDGKINATSYFPQ